MINRVILIGRLVRDVELVTTGSGLSRTRFDLAVDSRSKDDEGNRLTCYIPCVCFNQTAEYMVKNIRQGALISVEGRLNQRKYERQDGSNANIVEVICDNVSLLRSKNDDRPSADAPSFNDGNAAEPVDSEPDDTSSNLDSIDLPDSDLPF